MRQIQIQDWNSRNLVNLEVSFSATPARNRNHVAGTLIDYTEVKNACDLNILKTKQSICDPHMIATREWTKQVSMHRSTIQQWKHCVTHVHLDEVDKV